MPAQGTTGRAFHNTTTGGGGEEEKDTSAGGEEEKVTGVEGDERVCQGTELAVSNRGGDSRSPKEMTMRSSKGKTTRDGLRHLHARRGGPVEEGLAAEEEMAGH
jgi:hypothetical protein